VLVSTESISDDLIPSCLLSLGCQSGRTPHSNLPSPSTTLVPSPTSSVSSSQTSSKSISTPLLIGVTVGLTVLGIAIFLYSLYLYRHDSSRSPSRRPDPHYHPSRQTAALDRVPKSLKRGPMFIVDRRKYIFNIGGGNQASGASNHGRRGRYGPYDIGGNGHGMPWPDSNDHYGGGSTEYRYAGTAESIA
jgi:hypothetical protein